MRFPLPFLARGVLLLALLALLLAACASDKPGAGRSDVGPRAAFSTVAGEQAFFADTIVAQVRVGAMAGFERNGGGQERVSRRERPPGTPAFGGPQRREGSLGGREDLPADPQRPRGAGMSGGGSAPVLIHLRLVNRSATAVEVTVTDFLSPLGNFAVRPEKLVLAANESREAEPMASQLAGEIGSGEIQLTLRQGGNSETKTIVLERVAEIDSPRGP